MKQKIVNGTCSEKWGIKFPATLSFSGPVAGGVYETYAEIVAANDLPNNDEVVRMKNAQKVANTRSKLTNDAIEAAAKAFEEKNGKDVTNPYVEPTTANSPKMRWLAIYESLVAHGKPKAAAAEIATAGLDGYTPEDFDVDAE